MTVIKDNFNTHARQGDHDALKEYTEALKRTVESQDKRIKELERQLLPSPAPEDSGADIEELKRVVKNLTDQLDIYRGWVGSHGESIIKIFKMLEGDDKPEDTETEKPEDTEIKKPDLVRIDDVDTFTANLILAPLRKGKNIRVSQVYNDNGNYFIMLEIT